MSKDNKAKRVMTGLKCCSKPDYRECGICPYNEYHTDCTQVLMTEAFGYTSALRNSIVKLTVLTLTGEEIDSETDVGAEDEPVAFPDTPVNLKIDGFYEG